MSVWFFIWLGLSLALLYFMVWTLYILYRQKRAWKAYAAKMKLRYTPRNLLDSPQISGVAYGHTVALFSAEHATTDARGGRKLTAIEVTLKSPSPFDAILASGGMVEIGRSVNLGGEIKPGSKDWSPEWLAAASSALALEAYLTPERVEALVSIMKIKNAWIIFVMRGGTTLLRLDTSDPLDAVGKIDRILKRLTDIAAVLELKPGEEIRLKAASTLKPTARKPSAVKATEGNPEEGTGLSLEE